MKNDVAFITTPIGNLGDLTHRAAEFLRECELVICENEKAARPLLKFLGIHFYEGNPRAEHPKCHLVPFNRKESTRDFTFIESLLRTSSRTGIISDGGSPLLEDPGGDLVPLLRRLGITPQKIPGVTSLSVFMMYFPPEADRFFFQGFLPRESPDREKTFQKLTTASTPVVFLETPSRVEKMVQELNTLPPKKKILIGLDLTLPTEEFIHGRGSELPKSALGKREFICLVY